MLPPGQKPRQDFPRFGLPQYTNRFPSTIDDASFDIAINSGNKTRMDLGTSTLPRITLESDFHCVTTWSYVGAKWSGIKFSEFFESVVSRLAEREGLHRNSIVAAVFCAQDGYRTSLLVEDLLQDNVLLADCLDGKPLTVEHGAPLRLVAPAHYGYKNLKHLKSIEFHSEMPVIKRGIRAFLDHPRARVSKEERGRWIPGWFLRYIYRMLIPGTVKDFKVAMQHYEKDQKQ